MAAALLTVLAAIVGIPVASHLSAGGFQDPGRSPPRLPGFSARSSTKVTNSC